MCCRLIADYESICDGYLQAQVRRVPIKWDGHIYGMAFWIKVPELVGPGGIERTLFVKKLKNGANLSF